MVVKIHSEEEVKKILPYAKKHQTPVTFRAAGTSLSGQAVSDSIALEVVARREELSRLHRPRGWEKNYIKNLD